MVKGLSQNDPVQESFNLKSFTKNKIQLAVFALFFLGLFLLTIGAGLFLFKGKTPSDDIEIISSQQEKTSNSKIVVHVDGAVNKPGVYEVDADSRVNNVVDAAGGLTREADTQKINLAAKVADGQKIYIASFNDPVSSSSTGEIAGQSAGALININSASEAQLDTLPAVGPVTAQKIIASRPYSAPDDLLSKKVVGKSTYEKIKDLITVY